MVPSVYFGTKQIAGVLTAYPFLCERAGGRRIDAFSEGLQKRLDRVTRRATNNLVSHWHILLTQWIPSLSGTFSLALYSSALQ